MVHIVRPVWERVGQDNQLGRAFPPLGYSAADAQALLQLEPAPRTVRGARDLLSVALQYGNAFGQGLAAAALKPAEAMQPEPPARSSRPTGLATTMCCT
jgi:malate synthase